jgi:uncharacterized protein
MMSPIAEPAKEKKRPEAGASRITEAFFKTPRDDAIPPSLEFDARFTMSTTEVLRNKDFAQMSAAEIIAAREQIAKLHLPADEVKTRRYIPNAHGLRVDPRRSFRRSLKAGGSAIDLAFRARNVRHPPIVALCDISGSMNEYTRILLHFFHALGESRRVSTFLFGTRLTNVTRALRARDVDDALSLCSGQVKDWSGGTRIGEALHRFNREWSRRVLGQGAIVLLFTDGLERDDTHMLGLEMERLRKSCRRLIWANPLLRYGAFEAKAQGIRAMLPHVDEFRPIHSLANMADLCQALARDRRMSVDPKLWLKRSA